MISVVRSLAFILFNQLISDNHSVSNFADMFKLPVML